MGYVNNQRLLDFEVTKNNDALRLVICMEKERRVYNITGDDRYIDFSKFISDLNTLKNDLYYIFNETKKAESMNNIDIEWDKDRRYLYISHLNPNERRLKCFCRNYDNETGQAIE